MDQPLLPFQLPLLPISGIDDGIDDDDCMRSIRQQGKWRNPKPWELTGVPVFSFLTEFDLWRGQMTMNGETIDRGIRTLGLLATRRTHTSQLARKNLPIHSGACQTISSGK
jgi:hypothetical protein